MPAANKLKGKFEREIEESKSGEEEMILDKMSMRSRKSVKGPLFVEHDDIQDKSDSYYSYNTQDG